MWMHSQLRDTARESIDHAVGIVMSHGGRTPKDAFEILVRASQRENRKLREIAEEIVARTIERATMRWSEPEAWSHDV